MAFVSRELLRWSLEQLGQQYSPLLTVSIPCMLAKRVPVCSSQSEMSKQAIKFGSADERQWLDAYFRVPGGPDGKPYFLPGTGEWVQERYPDRSLQRRRKDFDGKIFFHPDQERWAFRAEARDVLIREILQKRPPISMLALMAWMWRDKDIPEIDSALQHFQSEIGFSSLGLAGPLFDSAVPPEWTSDSLTQVPLTPDDLADLLGSARPAPIRAAPDDITAALEELLEERHFIVPPGFVERIVQGWIVGEIVVLVGATGSGKTRLCQLLAEGLFRVVGEERFYSAFLEVSPDFEAGQFLGYESLAGLFVEGRFAGQTLFVGTPSDPRLVVLDEWNLGDIDNYFAPILSVLESGRATTLPGRIDWTGLPAERVTQLDEAQPLLRDGMWRLPLDSFFLATCNSWLEEPATRRMISGPVKRRCRIIHMPNALEITFAAEGDPAIVRACDAVLNQERSAVTARATGGQESIWDHYRKSQLDRTPSFSSFPDDVKGKILQMSRLLLSDISTGGRFTLGLLRDVVLAALYSGDGKALLAVGRQIADKVMHQMRGEPRLLEVLCDLSKDFSNYDEILRLAKLMGAFGGVRELRPLI